MKEQLMCKKIGLKYSLILFFVFYQNVVYSQQTINFDLAKTKTEIMAKSLLEDYPGITLAISVNKEIVYSKAFGISNISNNSPMHINQKFNMYSVSKAMTGTAIAKLWENGKIDLDTPIVQYLIELKNKPAEQVTIRQLLGHTSGIVEPEEETIDNWMFGRVANSISPRKTLKGFINIPLDFKSGTQMSYTTYGYVLLSAIIQAITGDYQQYMEEAIFKPAGMVNTFIDGTEPSIVNRTKQYVKTIDCNLLESKFPDASCKWGGGGYVTTSEDMVKFSISLMNDMLISRKGFDTMLTPILTSNGKDRSYGFGLVTYFSSKRNTRQANHGGGNLDGKTYLALFPDKKVGVAIALNLGSDKGDELAKTIFEIADLWLKD